MQFFSYLTDATVVFFFANTLYVISYMLTSMLWLRVLAIIAAASTFPYFYLQPEPLWLAMFWQSCFLGVNLVNLIILLYSMRAVSFDDDEQLAYEIKFSRLKPYEARPIFGAAEQRTIAAGKYLLKERMHNETLFLVLEGECRVVRDEAELARLGPGQFIGELSVLSDEPVSADVIAVSDTRLMTWDRERLLPLFRRQALYESYFHSLFSADVASKLRAMTGRTVPA